MDEANGTAHTPPLSAEGPATEAAEQGGGGVWVQATHELRRAHDGSVISTHCSSACGLAALEELTLAEKIGPASPGPLQPVRVDLVDLATGKPGAFATGMTPLNGEPTDVYSWP